MARPPICSTIRLSLQPGKRSYAETPRCYYHLTKAGSISEHRIIGVGSTPLRTHWCHRSLSQSATLHSSYPATHTEPHNSLPSARAIYPISTTHGEDLQQEHEQPNDDANESSSSRNQLPKQSSHTTHILFETIGPHVEQRTLQQLTKKLSRIISRGHSKLDTEDRAGKEGTLKRRLDMLFESRDGRRQNSEDGLPQYSWSLKGHPWMKQTLYSYLMGKRLVKPYGEGANLPFQMDPTYPPNRNCQDRQKHLDTLMKAREVSLHHPIFWTDKCMRESGYTFNQKPTVSQKGRKYQEKIARRHHSKSESQLQSEADKLLRTMSRLPPPHFNKVMSMLERFTTLDTPDTAPANSRGEKIEAANSWYIDDGSSGESNPLPELPESKAAGFGRTKHRIPVLGKSLGDCSASHSHLVAVPLGQYFYMDQFQREHGNGGEHDDGDHDAMHDEDKKEAALAIRNQRKIHSIQKKYSKIKSEFVDSIMELQHEFASWENAADTKREAAESFYDDIALKSVSENDENQKDGGEDEDVSSDFSVGEFQKAQAPYSLERRKEQKEELAETLVELRRMGLRKNEDGVDKKKITGRPKKGHHLEFTATRMVEVKVESTATETEPSTERSTVESESEERIVFINNLPIDTTESDIDRIYSRCGPLDSVQLFNLRPDLDPGPLSKKQQKERRRKKARNKNSFTSYNDRKQRPRTPVYGMLRFQTAEGYKIATSPELSIFGTVINRHPVLSITDVNTLYLEQIPSNLYSMDLEYKLAQLLHPHNVHIMLNWMNGVDNTGNGVVTNANADHQEYSMPSSCQVKFEDFDTAYKAYQWIIQGADGDGEKRIRNSAAFLGGECQVHWFRTPENSMEYWTRELTF